MSADRVKEQGFPEKSKAACSCAFLLFKYAEGANPPGLSLGLDLLLLTNSDNRGTKRASECTERLVHTLNDEASHGLGVSEIELHDS